MESKEAKNKNKNKSKLKWFILLVFIVLIIIGAVGLLYSKTNSSKEANNEEEYIKQVENYAHLIEEKVSEYLSDYDSYPTWQDIKYSVREINPNVICGVTITDLGNLTLKNCTVYDIEYTGDYIYESVVKKNTNLYIYSYGSEEAKNYNVLDSKKSYGDLIGSYMCDSDNCNGYGVNPHTKDIVVFDDNKYLIANYENTQVKKELQLTGEFKTIDFIYSSKKSYGLFVCKDYSKCAFYSFEGDKLITDFSYGFSDRTLDILLDKGYFSAGVDNDGELSLYILNNKTGVVYKTLNNAISLTTVKVGGDTLYIALGYMDYTGLYTEDFKPFTSESSYFSYAINKDNTITIESEKTFNLYNTKANEIFISKEYKRIVKAVEDYVVVLNNDDNLKIVNLKDEEVASLGKITENLKLHPMISGWYTDNGKYGIYVVVEDTTKDYGTKGAGLEYYYIPTTGETGIIETEGVGGYAKPVLYLYPTDETNVTVTFEKPYLLTTTYPKYNYNWNVFAKENGDLYDKDGKYYYALYWEEKGSTSVDFSEGFYVTKDNAITFLEEKLNIIGLTERESNEFIMYWLPILEKNEKSLVYFELTAERDAYNKLIINPVPDSLLRMAIHIKKVDKEVKIREEKLPTFVRHGFTAVEWGGVNH